MLRPIWILGLAAFAAAPAHAEIVDLACDDGGMLPAIGPAMAPSNLDCGKSAIARPKP